jgi:hypothetical protein
MRIRRIVGIVVLVVLAAAILFVGWRKHGPNQFEAALQPGSTITFDLSAGGFKIIGTDESQIKIVYDPSDLPYIHSSIQTTGSAATVTLDGPSSNFHATIYVPRRSHLKVFQTIGEIRISGVDGDKKVGLNIGAVRIQVPDRNRVKYVEASVGIGSVRAENWGTNKGGFFRSFDAGGQGDYSVKAHVDIGDLELGDWI